jgi:RNA polymerase sigma factor (sigma-70 family)
MITTSSWRALTAESDVDRAGRFVREAEPLMDVLSRRAQQLTRNHADAEELVQDVMLHAYRGFGSYEPGTNFKAWMFRILYNRWCSAHRVRQRRPAEVLTDDSDRQVASVREPERSAETEALAAQPHSDVRTAMGNLPMGVRQAVYYTMVAGYSYAETAELLGIPLGTVMSRVHRGRKRLRIALAHVRVPPRPMQASASDSFAS